MAAEYAAAADQAPGNADAQYRAALAASYLAEVEIELHDRKAGPAGRRAGHQGRRKGRGAQAGRRRILRAAGHALRPGRHRPDERPAATAPSAKDAIDKAVGRRPILPRSTWRAAWAISMCPRSSAAARRRPSRISARPSSWIRENAEAYLLLGLSLRKQNQNAEARQAIAKSLELESQPRLGQPATGEDARRNEAPRGRRALSRAGAR